MKRTKTILIISIVLITLGGTSAAQVPMSDDDKELIANLDFFEQMALLQETDFLNEYEVIEQMNSDNEKNINEEAEHESPININNNF